MRFLLIATLIVTAICFVKGEHGHGGEHQRNPNLSRKHHKHGDVHLNKEGKSLTLNKDEWLKTPHLRYTKGCARTCPKHKICIQDVKTGDEMCARKHYIKEGRRLFKTFHKSLLEVGKKSHHKNFDADQLLNTVEHVQTAPVSSPRKLEKPHNIHISLLSEPHVISEKEHHHDHHKKENRIENKGDAVIKMQNMLLDKAHEVQSIDRHIPNESEVCDASKMDQMKQRLTRWFSILRKEERRAHHKKAGHHSNKKSKRSLKSEMKRQKRMEKRGHCQCQRSVMWEMHKMDVDKDHYLSDSELAYIEQNHNEPCVRPFLKSCDHNADSLLSKQEWCCCFAEAANVDHAVHHKRK